MAEEDYNSDVSSFNDDDLYPSDLDFMSSDYVESDVEGYIPPQTRTKKALTQRLLKYSPNHAKGASEYERKEAQREAFLNHYQELIQKRRVAKTFDRLQQAKSLGLCDPKQEAFILEKKEIVDKHLNKGYYFEPDEPGTYKKLLGKRKRAIHRKYELYALDKDFRDRYADAVQSAAQEYASLDIPPLHVALESFDTDVNESGVDDCVNEKGKHEDDEDGASSFYDEGVPPSELEYFSSDFEDNLPGPYPGPKSRTLAKYKCLMTKFSPSSSDISHKAVTKSIKRAEIDAQFKNFVEKRRALKALGRLNAVKDMSLECPKAEAKELLNFEIHDKKLNNSYYYDPNEPAVYKSLLQKRRNAIVKKYEKYSTCPEFRKKLKHDTYVNVLRIQSSPMFEKDVDAASSTSSFNGSDIPTSEEDFMSEGEICLPPNYEKPLTNSKKALFKELEMYETDVMNDTQSIIDFKRKMRMETIKRFKNLVIYRRRQKAARRLKNVMQMCAKDPAILAEKLMALEIADKNLDRNYYYSPAEPDQFKHLRQKRLQAIRTKYEHFVNDEYFRVQVLDRIRREGKLRLE